MKTNKQQTKSLPDRYAEQVKTLRGSLAILQRLAVKMYRLADIPGLIGEDEIKDVKKANAELAKMIALLQ